MGLKFNKVDFRETKQSWSNFDLRWIQLFFTKRFFFQQKSLLSKTWETLNLSKARQPFVQKAGPPVSWARARRGWGVRADWTSNVTDLLIPLPSSPLPPPTSRTKLAGKLFLEATSSRLETDVRSSSTTTTTKNPTRSDAIARRRDAVTRKSVTTAAQLHCHQAFCCSSNCHSLDLRNEPPNALVRFESDFCLLFVSASDV